jgi:hypothetical protein
MPILGKKVARFYTTGLFPSISAFSDSLGKLEITIAW